MTSSVMGAGGAGGVSKAGFFLSLARSALVMIVAFLPFNAARLSLSFRAISAKVWGNRKELSTAVRKAKANSFFADILR